MKVAIVGGGPAGASLACELALAGKAPVLLDDCRLPDLVVGESLIPAVVPLLRRLGIEKRVAAISQLKPGVSFTHSEAHDIQFDFRILAGVSPPYAYNVPRPAFDRLLMGRALELGVERIPLRAELEADRSAGTLRLAPGTLAAVESLEGRQPDLIIDATGRRRLVAKMLRLSHSEGPRKDLAYFAHFEGCEMPEPEGQVVITRLEQGWAWRIPLSPERLSIGVVINRAFGETLGASPEARLEAALARDPALSLYAQRPAHRMSEVKTYTNYQIISDQGYGRNWALLGDAYGFVDPMLSPGLFLAMESARLLTEAILDAPPSGIRPRALKSYARQFRDWLTAWSELIEHFYSGRVFSLNEAGVEIGKHYRDGALMRRVQRHIAKNLAGMTAGIWTRRFYSRRLVEFAARRMAWGVRPPAELAIR